MSYRMGLFREALGDIIQIVPLFEGVILNPFHKLYSASENVKQE